MKFSATLALAVIVGLVASSSALPAQKRMIYYQRPAQYHAAPQRMMYVQYVQPSQFARSTQGAEALVAGESVATSTYLQDCDHAEADVSAAGPAVAFEAPAIDFVVQQGDDVLSEDVHATQAEAEVYPVPEETLPVFGEIPAEVDIVAKENEVSDDAFKVPRDFNLEGADSINAAGEAVAAEESPESPEVPAFEGQIPAFEAQVPAVEAPVESEVAADLPAPAPIAPVAKPVNRYLPAKKKVYVELDQSAESDEDTGLTAAAAAAEQDVEDEDEDEYVAPVATRRPVSRRPATKKPAKAAGPSKKESKPLPAGTFFPINFGGTSGGAIAIANALSTGPGGSATSHAIAYGSPDAASLRGCLSCKKH